MTTPAIPNKTDDPEQREFLRRVRPPNWTNPTPKRLYDLVVLGGGPAGLAAAEAAGADLCVVPELARRRHARDFKWLSSSAIS